MEVKDNVDSGYYADEAYVNCEGGMIGDVGEVCCDLILKGVW